MKIKSMEESTKMKKLPHNFKPLLKELSTINLSEKKNYSETIETFIKINGILDKNKCEPYDMDNVIKNYRIKTDVLPIVRDLKKFTYAKNKMVFEQARQSPEWTKCLKNLKKFALTNFDGYIHTADVEQALISVFKKYSKHWLGFWSIITLEDSGKINKINLFDIHDKDLFLFNLSKKIPHKLTDPETKKRISLIKE
jgi:hypothetical protein